MKKLLCINHFWLKVIAVITMTISHIGVFLSFRTIDQTVLNVLLAIGSISFPIFAFLIVEGMLHTKNKEKYLLRLGIMAGIIGIALIIIQYAHLNAFVTYKVQNIFMQLFIAALAIYCLELPKWKKLYALLPTAYVVTFYILLATKNTSILQNIPSGLIPDYTLHGFTIIVGTYSIIKYYLYRVHKAFDDPSMEEAYKKTIEFRTKYNSFAIIPLLLVVCLMTLFNYIKPLSILNIYDTFVLSYELLAIPFIFMYNGFMGLNNKYIKYGFYLYYPVHIILLYVIFILI